MKTLRNLLMPSAEAFMLIAASKKDDNNAPNSTTPVKVRIGPITF